MENSSAAERVCYVHCNFCNTILGVSVPYSSMHTIVTVRCGHCANLLSVNLGGAPTAPALQSPPAPSAAASYNHQHHHQDHLLQLQRQQLSAHLNEQANYKLGNGGTGGSSAPCSKLSDFLPPADRHEPPRMPPICPPEKRQRVPSAYNKFIKDEIQRIKSSNPDITHREAFSMAAKNWAHFPHIHFGLRGPKQAKLDQTIAAAAAETTQKTFGFY